MAQNARNNVLVVGGSSGIGLATAKLALTQLPGANVIISSSNKDKLVKAVEEITSEVPGNNSRIVDYVVGDVSRFDSQFDDVEAILKAATERLQGRIDHIIWTAGGLPRPAQNDKPSHYDALNAATTRSFGPATLVRLAKNYVTESRHSSITISSGVLIYRPMPGLGAILGASSMEALARGLAVDLAPIRTNFVVLGAIQTPLLDRLTQGNEERAKQLTERTLLKSIGRADEAAEAYLFSMRCAYVTGSRIDCDGGALLV